MKTLSFHSKEFECAVRESLNRPNGPIFDADAQSVISLDCDFNFDVEDIPALISFQNLKHLYIEVRFDNPAFLQKLTNLESLDIVWGARKDPDMGMFRNLKKLRSLFISGGDISDMNLLNPEALQELSALEDLSLHEFGSVDLAFLESMPQLRSFLCGYAYHVVHPDSISSLIHLEDLRLVDIKLNDLRFLDSLPDSLELELLACAFPQMIDLKQLDRFRRVVVDEITVMGEQQPPYRHCNEHDEATCS